MCFAPVMWSSPGAGCPEGFSALTVPSHWSRICPLGKVPPSAKVVTMFALMKSPLRARARDRVVARVVDVVRSLRPGGDGLGRERPGVEPGVVEVRREDAPPRRGVLKEVLMIARREREVAGLVLGLLPLAREDCDVVRHQVGERAPQRLGAGGGGGGGRRCRPVGPCGGVGGALEDVDAPRARRAGPVLGRVDARSAGAGTRASRLRPWRWRCSGCPLRSAWRGESASS